MPEIKILFLGSLALLAILCGCPSGSGPATDPAHPQPEPEVRKVALKPALEKGQTFDMTVDGFVMRAVGDRAIKQSYDFKMRLELGELDQGIPTRVTYTGVTGPQILLMMKDGEAGEEERQENTDGIIEGVVGANQCLTDARDKGRLSDDILQVFPPGPLFGFKPPQNPVEAGATWSSGDAVPVGPHMIQKKKLAFSDARGEYRLDKIDGKIAHISWTGTVVAHAKATPSESASWKGTVLFDLEKKCTTRIDIRFKAEFPEGMRFESVMAVTFEKGE